jgi:hypothetical protein
MPSEPYEWYEVQKWAMGACNSLPGAWSYVGRVYWNVNQDKCDAVALGRTTELDGAIGIEYRVVRMFRD